jgi:heme/copper-type cytochrome/quinol oxidase subunit 4
VKATLFTAAVVIVLSALVYMFFRIETPDAPLSSGEMVFVVLAVLVVCSIVQSIWRVMCRMKRKK